jgi:hypothetical protein
MAPRVDVSPSALKRLGVFIAGMAKECGTTGRDINLAADVLDAEVGKGDEVTEALKPGIGKVRAVATYMLAIGDIGTGNADGSTNAGDIFNNVSEESQTVVSTVTGGRAR